MMRQADTSTAFNQFGPSAYSLVEGRMQARRSSYASKTAGGIFMRLGLFAAFVLVLTVTAIPQQVYEPGNGVTMPIVVKEVRPQYTKAALDKKIQGRVLLRAVVLENGHIGNDVEVLTSLDADLDQQAVAALKQWEFKPGTRDGKPVAVRISCELTFTLK